MQKSQGPVFLQAPPYHFSGPHCLGLQNCRIYKALLCGKPLLKSIVLAVEGWKGRGTLGCSVPISGVIRIKKKKKLLKASNMFFPVYYLQNYIFKLHIWFFLFFALRVFQLFPDTLDRNLKQCWIYICAYAYDFILTL